MLRPLFLNDPLKLAATLKTRGHTHSAAKKFQMIMASYVSTGGGGTDYEVDVAAACLGRLLTGTADRLLGEGATPIRVGLQDRTGPRGFDDATIAAVNEAGDALKVFVQAKRHFSFAPSGEFSSLVQAIASHDRIDQGLWLAALVAGETTIPLEDVQTLLESARHSADAAEFRARWGLPGTTNPSKRSLLSLLRAALADDDDAVWRAMRRLVVLGYDYHHVHSRDRDAALADLDSHLTGASPDAATLFGKLRDLVLRHSQRAAQWTRHSLIAELGAMMSPSRHVQAGLTILNGATDTALNAIQTHIQGTTPFPALSLLRNELFTEAKEILSSERRVRLSGEGGSGKSGLLRRLADDFSGHVLALKDDRVVAQGWESHAGSLGIALTAQEVVDEFAASGPCLLAIDGADRLLLSARRGLLLDLLRAIAASPLRNRWSIVTSARDFQTSDLVASAFDEAGLTEAGQRCAIGSLDDAEINLLSDVFPAIKALAGRGDLGNRNRVLFLLREVLASPQLAPPYTEVGLAAAWATRGQTAELAQPERDQALAAIGELLLCRPERRPGRADISPVGFNQLLAEGIVCAHPTRDIISFTHDVHEDWVLARTFERHRQNLPELIDGADQPLWWLRAMRLLGQILLEDGGDPSPWLTLLAAIDAAPSLDPGWSRSLLMAPLYSERSSDILDRLESALLDQNAALLDRLLETLLVYETRLDNRLLKLPRLAEMSETERLRTVASLRIPRWRSWTAFLAWSLRKWRQWPANVVPRLSEVGAAWTFATEGSANRIAKAIVTISADWLAEVEDARHRERRDDHRDPFGLSELGYRAWEKIEARLRRTLKMGVTAAPDIVEAYLRRVTAERRLDSARGDLINLPRQVPVLLPRAYTDMAIAHFTPRRRRVRHDDWLVRPDCFSSVSFQDAGISHDHGFFPSSPLRGGFSDLFIKDETEALRLFHRLEMRASVFYRHFMKWHDRHRARPIQLETPWGMIPLWGDENVYRWSRGVLGSHVLGSAYLALEEWLAAQAAAGRPLAELFRLVLQPNGLVATASPCINVLVEHINTPGQIDAAGPFLGAPRLWDYDLRRLTDDRSTPGPIGFMLPDEHFEATKRVHARYAKRLFLPRDLLLPFQLMASGEARAAFHRLRDTWTTADLAAFEDELQDSTTIDKCEQRLARIRSDSDPEQIKLERNPEGEGLLVQIEPPVQDLPRIAQSNREHELYSEASRLSNWVLRCRERNALDPTLSLPDAIALADKLEAIEKVDEPTTAYLVSRFRASGIVGTAALVVRYASDKELDQWLAWARPRILAGCRIVRPDEDEGLLVDQAKLFDDPQLYGAEGLTALINRGKDAAGDLELAVELATHRLQDVAAAVVRHLDWQQIPDVAWRATVAAFDTCVLRRNRFWIKGDDKRAIAARIRDRKRAIRAARRSVARAPRSPLPPYENRWHWQRKWRWPLVRVRVQSKWIFDWDRAPALLAALDYRGLASVPRRTAQFQSYLVEVIDWVRGYAQDEVAKRYQNHFPYELMNALADAAGRLAAVGGSTSLWESFRAFDRRDTGDDLIGDYLNAIASQLVESGRSPDDRFWAAWQPPASYILERIERPPGYRSDFDDLSKGAAAAGFVGPYTSPIPPDWPHLDAILPAIDGWVTATVYSSSAALALLRFAERLDTRQRTTWLVKWLALYVEEHQTDQQFWGDGSNGDRAAALLKPLEHADISTRREVRRLLGVIADAGSLAAREVLGLFASGRT